MATLNVMVDLPLEETVTFLSRRESPLSFRGRDEDFFTFQVPENKIGYLVSSFPLELRSRTVQDQVARELEFKQRVNIGTLNFGPFPRRVTDSTKRVLDYFLDNNVACYLLLKFSKVGDIVIGGYNPRTDTLIGTRGDYIHR